MKLTKEEQRKVNLFFREYVDLSFKNPMNCIRLNSEHTDEHRNSIYEVCTTLLKSGIPFWTEVRLSCGCIPDIVCPTHIKPIIEVLCTETIEMFNELKKDKYPIALHKSFIFIDANVPFEEKMIW